MSERFAVPAALAAAVIPEFSRTCILRANRNRICLLFHMGLVRLTLGAATKNVTVLDTERCAVRARSHDSAGDGLLPFALVPSVAIAIWLCGTHSWLRSLALAAIPALVILAVGAPRAFDHYWRYGYLSLSAQEGGHFFNWFYGCLASANPCAERGRIVEEMRPIVENRIAALGTNVDNPFTASAVARELAVERILSTPPQVIAVSMSVGMFRVLMQTGFYKSFAQFRQPAHFISSMSGDSFLTRMGNFLVANKSNPFMWLWALAQAALIASRLIQLVGLVIGLPEPAYRGATIILLATIGYFLVVTGPVASPKYRLPFEPPLLLLFGMGWVWFYDVFVRAFSMRGQADQ